jgi:uncharacterized membrane protein
MDTVRTLSLVAALLTTGLMAGVYLAFAIAVLPGLARQDDRTFVAAMRGMNQAILNGWFAVVFAGPLLLGGVAVATRLPSYDGLGWSALALAAYGVTLGATAVVNVPLNSLLEATDSHSEARTQFEGRWVAWNVARTVACTAAFVAFTVALV